MSKYTRKDLDREARHLAKQVRQETGKPANLDHWFIAIGEHLGEEISLCAVIRAYDGLRQKNMAIKTRTDQ